MKDKAEMKPGIYREMWKDLPTRKLASMIYQDPDLASNCKVKFQNVYIYNEHPNNSMEDNFRANFWKARKQWSHYTPSIKIIYPYRGEVIRIAVYWGEWSSYGHTRRTKYQGFVMGTVAINFGKLRQANAYRRAVKTIKEQIKIAKKYWDAVIERNKEHEKKKQGVIAARNAITNRMGCDIIINEYYNGLLEIPIKDGLKLTFLPVADLWSEKEQEEILKSPANALMKHTKIEGQFTVRQMKRLTAFLRKL